MRSGGRLTRRRSNYRAPYPTTGHQRRNPREELSLRHRLGHEVGIRRPQQAAKPGVGLRVGRGEHEDRKTTQRRARAKEAQEVGAVHLGHHEVEEQDVRVMALDELQALPSAGARG